MSKVVVHDIPNIIRQFEKLPDPRCPINRRHLLVDIIVISMLGVLADCDGPEAIAQWAKCREGWLRKFLKLPNGIPSHDTIGRVLEALNPRAFQRCFTDWLESLCGLAADEDSRRLLAVDGKTLRRSHDRRRGLGALHLVSVWATQEGISLGQLATAEKSNEITAIPQLLEQVNVKDAIVTIDAAGCQKEIAATIVAGGGDYVLALKRNQETLHDAAVEWFQDQMENDFEDVQVNVLEVQEKSHGRQEHRTYYHFNAPADLPNRGDWEGLKTIGVAVRNYEVKGEEHSDVRFYISSLRRGVKQFARAVRKHWGIENTLHWSLDMTFREDENRTRGRQAADNLAWLRRLAVSLLKQHPGKQSMAMKRRLAGWNPAFLEEILASHRS